jgi:hypothetical protein
MKKYIAITAGSNWLRSAIKIQRPFIKGKTQNFAKNIPYVTRILQGSPGQNQDIISPHCPNGIC